jgi:L-serine dehydratase
MSFISIDNMITKAAETKKPLWEAVLTDDMGERGASRNDSICRMTQLWQTMREADNSYNPDERSISGLVGGDGGRMAQAASSGEAVCGSFVGLVMSKALRMGECNACMKRIVAAPTAGSCGVLPAVLISFQQQFNTDDGDMVKALFVAASVGQVIAQRAFISGAEGGCQAEIGSASAMAAAAVVTLRGGTPEQSGQAVALALKSLLGLVCDPVAGLVEVPCVKRNVLGAVNALTSADMALAGIKSVIPPDEVIDAMRSVGEMMHPSLKETAEGGLATTPTARRIAAEVMDN